MLVLLSAPFCRSSAPKFANFRVLSVTTNKKKYFSSP